MQFKCEGMIDLGPEKRKFSKEVDAANKTAALEYIYSFFGSHHKVRRDKITISDLSAVKGEQE